MKMNKPMGMIELGYEVLVMPLDAAHKIQAILAEHAIKVDRVYCNNANPTVYVQKPYEAPPVQVNFKLILRYFSKVLSETAF